MNSPSLMPLAVVVGSLMIAMGAIAFHNWRVNRPAVKPCPFCGETRVGVVEGSTFRWRLAECGGCGARAEEVRIRTMGEGTPQEWEEQARQEAIAAWNTRA